MKRIPACLALLCFLLLGCTADNQPDGVSNDDNEAERALKASGMTDIKLTGYRFFGCGEDDVFRTGFEATAPDGTRVTGVVCSGWLKGATVRID